jgi:hypothetical protein
MGFFYKKGFSEERSEEEMEGSDGTCEVLTTLPRLYKLRRRNVLFASYRS